MAGLQSHVSLISIGEALAHEHYARHLWVDHEVLEHTARRAAEKQLGGPVSDEAIEEILRAYEREWEVVTFAD